MNAAIFEPRFEVMLDALVNEGFYDAAPLILELLEEHGTGGCIVCAADFSLISLGFWREVWPASGRDAEQGKRYGADGSDSDVGGNVIALGAEVYHP